MTRHGILIVARDDSVREGFRECLLAHGWSLVDACESAAQAVERMRSVDFGLAIIHQGVRDMSGLQAAPVIHAADPRVKILFATPVSTAELEARVRELDVFYYYLYSAIDSPELVAAVEGAIGPAHQASRPQLTILVVDDDQGFRDGLSSLLGQSGYRVVGAATIREGLARARELRPDLVVLDIMLESTTDGFLFSHEVRRDPLIKHTPILAVSAVGQRGGLQLSLRKDEELLPVDGFLEKPVLPEVLLQRIAQLVGQGEAS